MNNESYLIQYSFRKWIMNPIWFGIHFKTSNGLNWIPYLFGIRISSNWIIWKNGQKTYLLSTNIDIFIKEMSYHYCSVSLYLTRKYMCLYFFYSILGFWNEYRKYLSMPIPAHEAHEFWISVLFIMDVIYNSLDKGKYLVSRFPKNDLEYFDRQIGNYPFFVESCWR